MAYRIAARRLYLFKNDFIRRLIDEHAVEDDFAAAQVPLFVTATNLSTGHKHVFSEGKVSEAVLASTAIPGVFEPVEIDGELYIDGGVVANLDLETAVELGAREVLAIDLSHCFQLPEPKNVIGVITRTVDIVMRERVQRDYEALRKRATIALIQPEITEGPGVGDLRYVSRLIERGERFGEQVLEHCFDGRGRLRAGIFSAEMALPVETPETP
jgi:NTE family protein